MNTHFLLLDDPPELSDQAASEMLDFLYQMVNAFENQYTQQLRRYQQSIAPPHPDTCEDCDDESPPF